MEFSAPVRDKSYSAVMLYTDNGNGREIHSLSGTYSDGVLTGMLSEFRAIPNLVLIEIQPH